MMRHNDTLLIAIFQDNLGNLVPECLHFGSYWS